MSVPVSLNFIFPNENQNDYLASIHRELYYWKSCEKIKKFNVSRFMYEGRYAKDVDLLVHFATKVAKVEEFTLVLLSINDDDDQTYEFPQYAFKNSLLKDLELRHCQLNPSGSVNWSSLISLRIGHVELTDDAMEKVLFGCPNVESLELENISGLQRLEISSMKMRELLIEDYYNYDHDIWLEIIAPHIQHLEILGLCSEICIAQRNVASLVNTIIRLNFYFQDEENNLLKELICLNENNLLKELICLNDLLHSVAHVESLELGAWCIEFLSILELNGWRSPPSSQKFLELNISIIQLDFPGIYNFLESSSDLETLVIDCCYDDHNERGDLLARYANEDDLTRRFEMHDVNRSFSNLKTIKIDNFYGPLSENKFVLQLVKYLLKHAAVLEEFVITSTFQGMSPDYVRMAEEFLNFPISSPHASVVFSAGR